LPRAVSNAARGLLSWSIPRLQLGVHFLEDQEQKPMRIRRLILFALILVCLFSASRSIAQGSDSQPSNETVGISKPADLKPDFNREIYYKNRLEFSLESGWLPINIPFAFDFLLGDGYHTTPLKYTLVPTIASLRWQLDAVRGPWILRGNWDLSFSGALVVIPRGPETHYGAYLMGVRRNFVQPRWRIAPYFDGRLGLGGIDAKEPLGVTFAQGQDFTFTLNLGSGVRYNFNPRCSLSAGMNYMHISNLYLSEPKYLNYGINVYGPVAGINIRLGKAHHDDSK
jgi:Lipid A 3-O-deacylase (PagL)